MLRKTRYKASNRIAIEVAIVVVEIQEQPCKRMKFKQD
jgi:hypothetical protein